MEPTILTIDGKAVAFRASGATYLIYKSKFKRDLFKEFQAFEEGEGELSEGVMETLFRAGYVMAEQANPSGLSFEDWCDQFSFIGLARDIPKVAQILVADKATTEEAKKKNLQSGK